MLKIKWTDRITSDEVFQRTKEERFFSLVALRPNAGHGLLIHEVSRSHTTTHHSRQVSSGQVISSSQRPLPDNAQHSQQTNIHASSGIRTHDLSRRAAAVLRLRPRGHQDRQEERLLSKILGNRRHSWIGHTVRRNEFVVNILEGAISGKKAMGRPRLRQTSTTILKASHHKHSR